MSAPRYSWRRYKVSPSICVGVQVRSQVLYTKGEKEKRDALFLIKMLIREEKYNITFLWERYLRRVNLMNELSCTVLLYVSILMARKICFG